MFAFGLMACNPSQSAAENATSTNIIDANHYDAFWIWGDISSAPYLAKAKEIYVLQGEVKIERNTKKSILIPQGVAVLRTYPEYFLCKSSLKKAKLMN